MGISINAFVLFFSFLGAFRGEGLSRSGGTGSSWRSRLASAASLEVTPNGYTSMLTNSGSGSANSPKSFPRLIYGTAWKGDSSEDLVYQAIKNGFRHIDTACQPKHYNEAGVGRGWRRAANELGLDREDIFIQTKFTTLSGQDPDRLPYDQGAELTEQVKQSFEASLKNLNTDYIDSLVMHGPEDSWEKTLAVWRVFETFVEKGKVRQLGVSNMYDPSAVEYLYKNASVKPAVVQNRFYAESGHDKEIRKFCLDHSMEYQSFWTLGANRHVIDDSKVKALAVEKGLTPETLMYAFVMAIGATPLDGTTSETHMKEDIALLNRIQSGVPVFETDVELKIMSSLLEI